MMGVWHGPPGRLGKGVEGMLLPAIWMSRDPQEACRTWYGSPLDIKSMVHTEEEALHVLRSRRVAIAVLDAQACGWLRPGFIVQILTEFPRVTLLLLTREGCDHDVVATLLGQCSEYMAYRSEEEPWPVAWRFLLALQGRGEGRVGHLVIRASSVTEPGAKPSSFQILSAWRRVPFTPSPRAAT
jgi:hypothetical protein